ncbi:glycosyltransferase [Candidatus Parvarchaeota archaeon]|nr:glycosyltransferase [Candidatus Parvarchaeota archaeon]
MIDKIKVLLVSVSFAPKSGLGIIEHGILLYKGLKKYARDVDARAYSLSNKRLFDMVNKTNRKFTLDKDLADGWVKGKPDIIHYMSPGIFVSSLFLKPFLNIKSKQVVSIHDLDMFKKIPKIGIDNYVNKATSKGYMYLPVTAMNRFAHVMEKRGMILAIKKADHILCVSENTRRDLINMGVEPYRISVIYNIVGNNFKRLEKPRKKDKIIIGHLSSYAYNKNAEMLIKAFKKVKSDKFELHLYGAKLPFDISDDKRIKYFGHATDTVKMYNSFDVFVFPSLWEGFGMPIMEAKRCKIPVITYKKGELPDIVKRNTLQFKNEKDLTKILENTKWKKVNVNRAYKDTKECEEKVIIKELEKMYRKVLGGG